MITLKDLKIGQSGTIQSVGGEGALRQHFLDMGMVPGVVVSVVKFAPMGDPMEIKIHGYELSLRLSEAEKIEISDIETIDRIQSTCWELSWCYCGSKRWGNQRI